MLSAAHPTIFKLIDCLKKELEVCRAKIEKIIAGNDISSGREKYKQSAARLKKLVDEYTESDPEAQYNEDEDENKRKKLEYLRGVAHNIEYNV